MDARSAPDIAQIREIAASIAPFITRTPFPRSVTLSNITGATVFLKEENRQFTASFKERGALAKLLSLSDEQGSRGVVAMSAGNHAQAVAYHARRLGISAKIVMPVFTPTVKVEHTRELGASVVLHGQSLEECAVLAEQIVHDEGRTLVHPYDDPAVVAGQGSVALEMLQERPGLDVLVVPVGGGGLIAGMAVAARALHPDIQVIGVQTERYPAVAQRLRGEAVACGEATLAEGIAVKNPGQSNLELIRDRVDEVLVVSETRIEEAVLLLLEVEKTLVEGAGAASLAALLQYGDRFRGRQVGLVLSGGNIDPMILSNIIQRGLVRSARLARLEVAMADRPGALARVTALLGDLRANIVEIRHERGFNSLTLDRVEVGLVVETRGETHLTEILQRLRGCGYAVQRVIG